MKIHGYFLYDVVLISAKMILLLLIIHVQWSLLISNSSFVQKMVANRRSC